MTQQAQEALKILLSAANKMKVDDPELLKKFNERHAQVIIEALSPQQKDVAPQKNGGKETVYALGNLVKDKWLETKPSKEAQLIRGRIKLDTGKYTLPEGEMIHDYVWDLVDVAIEMALQSPRPQQDHIKENTENFTHENLYEKKSDDPLLKEPPIEGLEEALLDPEMSTQKMRLHMGELTANEVRVARSAIMWANTAAKRWAEHRRQGGRDE